MADRRGSRFVAEALFLVALAVALAFARLHALEIAGAMILGWIVVAAIEWAAWRGEPHFGSGIPPRYYVPSVKLPPPQPLEQVDQGYPDASKDEAPTWIASAALRAEVLGEWPVAAPVQVETEPVPDEEEAAGAQEPEPEHPSTTASDDPWDVAELPPEPLAATVPEPPAEERFGPPEDEGEQAEPAKTDGAVALHRWDPLPEVPSRRRWRRPSGSMPDDDAIVVPRRVRGRRLPSSLDG